MGKPILCIDFDGVIHDYRRGWQDGKIYGQVMPGFFEWAVRAKERFQLVIYSSRSKTPEGIEAMKFWLVNRCVDWLTESGQPVGMPPIMVLEDFTFAYEKPPAFLTIDDRAVTFKGDWRDAHLQPGALAAFKTWSQK